jgi:hypothetical protein
VTSPGDLRAVVDGVPLPADEARALWRRFSDWMNERAGDLSGFAVAEGLASVRPELHDGVPVLACSRTDRQTPYGPAAKKRARGEPPAAAAAQAAAAAKSKGNETSRKRPRGRR